ncbi:MAG TPA: L-threonine 3-dehydrogenase [Bacilli bacterium]|nr:MAG: L-threonine 3-dehydrogenase [Tenericutes bacterium ADurb.BinA124]HNZ50594.1 L-threonine 3-dehydrogenase [Bacilli bacterium]HPX84517.1 L-threonine 3-dehydrogenase [Bacilli bacterium]HQC75045.1 L-threonine 3-dehydrogenase [Bacilli bacterium]
MTKLSDDEDTITMMAVVKDQPHKGFSYVKKQISTALLPHEVLVKVAMTSFCGTDYHIYSYDAWAQKRLKLPLTVGHEFSGEIVKVGDKVTRVKIGDLVSAETHIICHECEFCLRGEGHICENTKVIGVDTDGCFARYVKIPEHNCFINSPTMNPLHLSVQEPLGNAVHTIAHFDVNNKDVVILGCGPIGLMGVDVAKALGAKKVIAIEVKPYRAQLAQAIGADVVINPLQEDVIARVFAETNGRGADVIGEFSGNKVAIEQAFKYLKAGGGMSMLGIPSQKIELDFATEVVFKGISIYGVTGRRIYDTWYQVRDLLEKNLLHLDKIITHIFPLREINQAAEIMGSGNSGKIVLIPEDSIDE